MRTVRGLALDWQNAYRIDGKRTIKYTAQLPVATVNANPGTVENVTVGNAVLAADFSASTACAL